MVLSKTKTLLYKTTLYLVMIVTVLQQLRLCLLIYVTIILLQQKHFDLYNFICMTIIL